MTRIDGPRGEKARGEFAQQALEALQWNWGDAYGITVADGVWSAMRRDGMGDPIEASEPEDLRKAILDDYITKPVPRDCDGGPVV